MIRRKGSFRLDKKRVNFTRFKKRVPVLLANESRNHFVLGFRKGGGQTDQSKGGWRPRKGGRDSRAILVKSGALKNDVRVLVSRWARIVVGSLHLPYARRHNEGLAGMPQREFVGESRSLKRKHLRIIIRNLIGI